MSASTPSSRTVATDAARHRLFFALMPPPPVAKQISHRARVVCPSARIVPADRLHLTLAFIGVVDAQGMQAALAAGDAVDAPAFALTIDRAGCFRRTGVSWLAPSAPPPALLDLSTELYKNTRLTLDKDRFKPHITIARKNASLETGPIEPITWSVGAFSLITSGSSGQPGVYHELRRWRLPTSSVDSAQ